MPQNRLTYSRIFEERTQGHETRKPLLKKLEAKLGRPVLSYFTSFSFPVGIDDSDANMIQMVLQQTELRSGFALIVSSPGGDGLAAERIVRACRSYSGTGEYWAMVPSMAKSAATLICFGASKIMMSVTSELGPVDPQIVLNEDGEQKVFPAYTITETYKDLFERATKETGKIEPYLQQLDRYDARRIKAIEAAIALSRDISINALKTGMLAGKTDDEIESLIETFVKPERTRDHARPIYHDEAQKCGLNVEVVDPKSEVWKLIYELYLRTDGYVSLDTAKCLESKDFSLAVPVTVYGGTL